MKKELKDYLHLYLGCEVLDDQKVKRTLRSVNIESDTCALTYNDIGEKEEGIDIVTPILRDLASMTDEEMLDIAKMHNDKAEWKIIDGKPMGRINIGIQECLDIDSEMVLVHEIKNNIFDQESEGGYYRASLNNNEYIRYLLSKHFDLFGLIEEGLAVTKFN